MEYGKLLRKILSPHWNDLSSLEVKIFLTLYWLAEPDSRELQISLQRLENKVYVPINVLIEQLGKLLLRGLISFRCEENSSVDSHFKILFENKTQDIHTQGDLFANIGEELNETLPYVNDNVKNKNKTSNDIVNVTRAEKESTDSPLPGGAELTARQIAKVLGDEQNIRLYEAYFSRYPQHAISKAYHQVLNTPRQRIKKSPGAYFTFLARKYGSAPT